MSDHWSQGYVTDINYTHGYYGELNPARLSWALACKGIVAPKVETACELGFGQGLSTVLHSTASDIDWWATDFNPTQAGGAQTLADEGNAAAHLFDQSFAEFCGRDDLPDFDFIGLHGIWTWISDENRRIIVDFARRKLKTGGVFYISYNTLPGWSGAAPMRNLIAQHGAIMGAPGTPIPERIDAALEFTEKLFDLNPGYIRSQPYVNDRLKKIKEQDRSYLAHEYFTEDWQPMYYAEMARWLQDAKLSFAGSAHFLDAVDAMNLTTDQQEFMKTIPDLDFQQTVRDYMVNQQFRRDYWVKGAQILPKIEQVEILRQQSIVLVKPRDTIELKAVGSLGEAAMTEDIYNPILDILSDYKPKTMDEIEAALSGGSTDIGQLVQAITVLIGNNSVQPVQNADVTTKSKEQCAKLNLHLQKKARSSNDISVLVSPVTGGGISVGRFAQLFMLARSQGHKTVKEWADFAWKCLAAQGQLIRKNGEALQTPEENKAELEEQATVFKDTMLPVLKGLKIV